MSRSWSFNRKVAAGFALVAGLAAITVAISVVALRAVVASKDHVIRVSARDVADARSLEANTDLLVAIFRGFLLTKSDRFLEQRDNTQKSITEIIGRLRGNVDTDEGRRLLGGIEGAQSAYRAAQDRVIDLRKNGADLNQSAKLFETEVVPLRDTLARLLQTFIEREENSLNVERQASSNRASSTTTLVIVLALVAGGLAMLVAFLLGRALSRQIGAAVQHVQSSSVELQSAANQQASGAKESATAMNEVATTISELLATSRQIAESAQQVARIAQETASAARVGDQTVEKAQEGISNIRRQVDIIVSHMLDLGRKSQQIGGVLEIITELAEQTNILAINATIEAAGAGDAGKRFAVVGDEIRKLADRVGGSTKEIRGLIEEIRSTVNTTVMATEGGSKAVDAGMRHFSDVTGVFSQITGLVTTTTQAAREIELSTKQQTTAVEQVNLAIVGAAQATRETEASSTQTLQTATQLAGLSRDLSRIIQAKAA